MFISVWYLIFGIKRELKRELKRDKGIWDISVTFRGVIVAIMLIIIMVISIIRELS